MYTMWAAYIDVQYSSGMLLWWEIKQNFMSKHCLHCYESQRLVICAQVRDQ